MNKQMNILTDYSTIQEKSEANISLAQICTINIKKQDQKQAVKVKTFIFSSKENQESI